MIELISFFDVHTHWFLFMFFMFIFPRLTMLVTGICFFPWTHIVLFWFGWLLTPRLVVAILATFFYFHVNPILCVFTWIWAFSAGHTENRAIKNINIERKSKIKRSN